MKTISMAASHVAAIDLNQPGTYLHWSIFEISVANLVVIAVMVVIFGAALLLPLPPCASARACAFRGGDRRCAAG